MALGVVPPGTFPDPGKFRHSRDNVFELKTYCHIWSQFATPGLELSILVPLHQGAGITTLGGREDWHEVATELG